jgi:hypothetical protein
MPTKEERHKLKKEYGDLFEKVSKVLFEEDPVALDLAIMPTSTTQKHLRSFLVFAIVIQQQTLVM